MVLACERLTLMEKGDIATDVIVILIVATGY